MTNLCTCGTPVAQAFLCSGCAKTLEIALGNISAYWRDLDNVRSGQTRYGDGSGGRHGETPLAVDARFAGSQWVEANNRITGERELQLHIPNGTALVDAAKNTVATWVRIVMGEKPLIHGPTHPACLHVTCSQARRSRWPADTIPACCIYLLGHANWIRTQHWAPEILDEMQHIEGQLRRVVDRPADKWFAGPCDTCERDLYATVGAASVECAECDLVYDVDARRVWLLEQAQDRLLTAAELSRAVSWLGTEPLTAARVWKWAQRKRIVARGMTLHRGNEIPTYLVSDAIDLMAQDARPRAG